MFKKIIGPLLILLVGILPVCLLLFATPVFIDTTSPATAYDSFARMAGLSALSLLSLNIILSARLGVLSRLFLGMDRAYRYHRIIGGLVLILVLAHVMLITAKYSSISLISGYEFLKPSLDVALGAGRIALAVILIGVFVSMYINVKYKWFITIQRLLGAMVFVGGYHAFFVSGSDLRSSGVLLGYFGVIGGLAAGLYIYRSLFHKSLKKRLQYRVDSVTFNQGITNIWLRPVGRALAFYAGQFGFYRFQSEAVDSESHPFSISSGSNDERLRLSVKAIGDYTTDIQNVSVGDTVSVEGAYGEFSFTKVRSNKQAWIAGGIGVTPFLSMAQSLPAGYEVTLFYCTKTLTEAEVFLTELWEVTAKNPGFRVVTVSDDQGQRLAVENVVATAALDYFLCAPLLMMKSIEQQLVDSGIKKSAIHYEEFRLK